MRSKGHNHGSPDWRGQSERVNRHLVASEGHWLNQSQRRNPSRAAPVSRFSVSLRTLAPVLQMEHEWLAQPWNTARRRPRRQLTAS